MLLRALPLAVFLAGCSLAGAEDEGVVEGVDLDLLFAPPTATEIAAVKAEWASRDVSARAVEVIREGEVSEEGWTASVRILTHEVGTVTHFGAVLVPAEEPERERPVLVYLHGGDAGVSVDEEVAALLSFVPEIRDEFVVVVPSFRSEPLNFDGETYRSDGPPSPWDRDVDDALSLLDAAIAATPSADPDRVVALGFSRGAGVGLLMSARDDRIDGVVEFFGPTDFFGPFVREVTRDALRGHLADLPGLTYLNDAFLQPLKQQEIAIDAVRLGLLRRSPVYFVDLLSEVQIHHGLADDVVPPAQGQALVDALEAAGVTEFEAYFYEGGLHNALTLSGSIGRARSFLLRFAHPVPV